MANKITFRKRYKFVKNSFNIYCNGEPITGKNGDISTARASWNAAKNIYTLNVFLYVSETQFVTAEILADPDNIKPALNAARAFVRHTLSTPIIANDETL